MLNIVYELYLILSILTPLIILNGVLTYNKEKADRRKVVFFILLFFIYIIAKLTKLFSVEDVYAYNIITAIVFVLGAIYYKYFYKIGYVKYTTFFYLFYVYYLLFRDLVSRNMFLIITGAAVSSEKSLLVPYFDCTKIDIYSYVFIIFIYIFAYLITKNLNKYLELLNSDKRNYIYLSIALMFNLTTIIVIYISNKFARLALTSERHLLDYIVTPKLILASSIVLVLLFVKVIKDNKIKSQNEIMKNKLDMQYEHYLSVKESHMKVRKLYHDINNHISDIDNLKSNSQEVSEYVNNLKDEIKEFKSIYNTGNMILDIIINEKNELCNKKGIKFICDINFSKANFIKPMDVSSIFANILDNAIEACDKIHDDNINKHIRIKGTISKSYFVLKCENSKVNYIKANKNIFLTDKIDKFKHGIGIQSIKSSLERYEGEILFEDEKDKFTLNIYIPLNHNTDSWVL
ncbi:GHKL domain-containing protein [Terrisporobacter petrolearius]|uniref:sensor histidine kinase n=1 Tax=Terrisporobacter petrolearius TaxID=1460447 RepID=UPI001D166877|nr:sensor histidine kinase [Terrisporobacter petrolearius]MCC3866396.1 GHKL domain-containing protein [Terrisporobacter petrolearius]